MRIFVLSDQFETEDTILLDERTFHYLSRVRRVKSEESLVLVVDQKKVMHVSVVSLGKGTLRFVCDSEGDFVSKDRPLHLTLTQSLPKQSKFSDILDVCTQIGVDSFIPLVTSRTIVDYSSSKVDRKMERWQDVISSASRQSGRVKQPELEGVTSFETFCDRDFSNYDVLLVAWEEEEQLSLKESLERVAYKNDLSILVLIGPEGGLSGDEVSALKHKGFVSVSLGDTILRTEHAGFYVFSQIKFNFL